MTTVVKVDNAKVTTVFDSNGEMIEAIVENDSRICTISFGIASETWAIFLDKKEEGFDSTLRTYLPVDKDHAIKYFDKKLKEFK